MGNILVKSTKEGYEKGGLTTAIIVTLQVFCTKIKKHFMLM